MKVINPLNIAKSPTDTPSSIANLKNVPTAVLHSAKILMAMSALTIESFLTKAFPILADFPWKGRLKEFYLYLSPSISFNPPILSWNFFKSLNSL